jgi:membrane-associated phospholipid phosphatase
MLCLCLVILSPRAVAGELLTPREDNTKRVLTGFPVRQLILPAVLVTYGTVEALAASRVRLLNYAIGHPILLHPPAKIKANDATQYFPIGSVYALNLIGIRGRHHFRDCSVILGLSALFMAASVNALKYTTRELRPDKSARNSFPSGHTAMAFMGAEFLHQEYKELSIWYGIAGYTIAACTGACRVYNNKHWVGDVSFGAGLGILSTKLAYWLSPAIEELLARKGKTLSLSPFYNGRHGGLSCSLSL